MPGRRSSALTSKRIVAGFRVERPGYRRRCFARASVAAFGQKAGGSSIESGARLSQSVHTTAVSQRWHASIACARCDTPVGQAAGTVERPSRPVMAAMFRTWSGLVLAETVGMVFNFPDRIMCCCLNQFRGSRFDPAQAARKQRRAALADSPSIVRPRPGCAGVEGLARVSR